MRRFWAAIASAILGAAGASADSLLVGAYAEDVTPAELPISLAGSMADVQATEVHDRIFARAIVLDDGRLRLGVVLCDSCMIPRELFDEAKGRLEQSLRFPPANLLMAATHSHTCPTVAGVFQSEPNERYRKQLVEGIAAAVRKAVDRLAPATFAWGGANCPDQVFNRRWRRPPEAIPPDPFGRKIDRVQMNPPVGASDLLEPAGPVDPQVCVLQFAAPNGRPRALLANYSLHYVGGVPARSVSADYFGEFARIVAKRAAPSDDDFVAVLSNGTSGDVNNINFREPQQPAGPFERIRCVAGRVADAALSAVERAEPVDRPTLAAARREIELRIRKPTPEEVEQARLVLEQAGDRPLVGTREIYARETLKLADYPETVRLWVQALRIGPVGVVAIPCEVFAEIGLEIKEKSPLQPTFTIELANGYNGYLPTPAQHELGGYETWRARSSCLEVDASVKITRTALDLLDEVAGE
jgi:hypothetical protein